MLFLSYEAQIERDHWQMAIMVPGQGDVFISSVKVYQVQTLETLQEENRVQRTRLETSQIQNDDNH